MAVQNKTGGNEVLFAVICYFTNGITDIINKSRKHYSQSAIVHEKQNINNFDPVDRIGESLKA